MSVGLSVCLVVITDGFFGETVEQNERPKIQTTQEMLSERTEEEVLSEEGEIKNSRTDCSRP